MRDENRDPYAAPPAPRERGGPMLRFLIVAALLAAAVWAYMAYSQGPGLTQEANQAPTAVADASRTRGYTASQAEIPETAPPPGAPAPAAPRRDGAGPAPATEPPPPPTTTTIPPA